MGKSKKMAGSSLQGTGKESKAPLPVDVKLLKNTSLIFRSILNGFRMEIMEYLHIKGTATVTEIYTALQYTQSVASHHLKIMRDSGIVNREHKGKEMFYSINYDRLKQIHTLSQEFFVH